MVRRHTRTEMRVPEKENGREGSGKDGVRSDGRIDNKKTPIADKRRKKKAVPQTPHRVKA